MKVRIEWEIGARKFVAECDDSRVAILNKLLDILGLPGLTKLEMTVHA
jgi:hypothetical protein